MKRELASRTLGAIIGWNIARLRKLGDETQQQLCVRLCIDYGINWTQSQLSIIENGGKDRWGMDEMIILSWAFNVPLAELVDRIYVDPEKGVVYLSKKYRHVVHTDDVQGLVSGRTMRLGALND